MTRKLVIAFGVLSVFSLPGCLIGPPEGRPMLLANRDWKAKIQRPLVIKRDFQYQGEHFEQYVYDDELQGN